MTGGRHPRPIGLVGDLHGSEPAGARSRSRIEGDRPCCTSGCRTPGQCPPARPAAIIGRDDALHVDSLMRVEVHRPTSSLRPPRAGESWLGPMRVFRPAKPGSGPGCTRCASSLPVTRQRSWLHVHPCGFCMLGIPGREKQARPRCTAHNSEQFEPVLDGILTHPARPVAPPFILHTSREPSALRRATLRRPPLGPS